MKPLRTIAIGLIISAWGIMHFVNTYIAWLMKSSDFGFAQTIKLSGASPSLFGFPIIFSLGYIIFCLGLGVLLASTLQEAIDKVLLKNRERITKNKG